jgi:hypothetical protein
MDVGDLREMIAHIIQVLHVSVESPSFEIVAFEELFRKILMTDFSDFCYFDKRLKMHYDATFDKISSRLSRF